MSFFLPASLVFALLDRTLAVGLGISAATVGLLVRGGYYTGKRLYYGKQLTTEEKVLVEIERLRKIAEALEERERALENREITLEKAIGELVKYNYKGKDNIEK